MIWKQSVSLYCIYVFSRKQNKNDLEELNAN